MTEDTQSLNDSGQIKELAILIDKTEEPTDSEYPSGFLPEGQPIWVRMFADPKFQDGMKRAKSLNSKWALALRKFSTLCYGEGVSFDASKGRELAMRALRFDLFSVRGLLCSYLDKTKLFTGVETGKSSLSLSYQEESVTVNNHLQFSYGVDRSVMERFLRLKMGLVRGADGQFHKRLAGHVRVSVRLLPRAEAVISYTFRLSLISPLSGKKWLKPFFRVRRLRGLPISTQF